MTSTLRAGAERPAQASKRHGLRSRTILLLCLVACSDEGLYAQRASDPMMAHLDGAQVALRSGDQDRAALEYKAFLGQAIHRIANARARMGESDRADLAFDEALGFVDFDPTMRLDYASALFDQGRLPEARAMAQSALERDQKNARAEVVLGRINFEEREYSQAAKHFEAAAARGYFAETWRLGALSYLRSQQLPQAQLVLSKALRTFGDTTRNQVIAASLYYYGDYPQLAIQELRKVLARTPQAPDAHYYLGIAYLAQNEAAGYGNAVPEFEAQLKDNPQDFRGHYMLGYIALEQHQLERAERHLLQAARINSGDQATNLLLSQLYAETARGSQAEKLLRAMTASSRPGKELNFTLVRAHYMLGRLLEQRGAIDEGKREIVVAEKLRAELRARAPETYSPRSLTPLAEGEFEASSNLEPLAAAERAKAQQFISQLQPIIGEAYNNLARISVLHQDTTTASRYWARAVAWDPSLGSGAH